MAEWRWDLRDLILANGAAKAACAGKVAWQQAQQKWALPFVVLTAVTDPRPQHLKGYDAGRVSRVQCDCIAESYVAAAEMAETVLAALALPATAGNTKFGRIKAEGPVDRSEDVPGIGPVFRASMDLLVEHCAL